jgi:hypothetical protein
MPDYDAIYQQLNERFSGNGPVRSLSNGTLQIAGVTPVTVNTPQRPANLLHQQPKQRYREPRPDAAGCGKSDDGLHQWMKNGRHPVSKKQRWRCLRCKLSDSTEVE